jgi:class 3 adenylate cyclase/tetratricopeptide (TPR) repeat protein
MFVDLAGSTALSTRLDPEDMREVVRAYQDAVSGAVARFEGHVAKFMGDGVLAYFGWPRAHEDAAERAVRAGLAVAGAVARLEAPGGAPLAARVGIATGPVVVGDLVGSGEARERAVVGETPNLAARLQELAGPGGVVVAEGTRRLLGGLFAYHDLGLAPLKGFAEPVPAWRVAGEGDAEGRFEALHGERLTPLVGREHELGILLERWAWARDGDGQVVLLAGEPGIGKSRLVRAFRERLGDEPPTTLGHYCSPHHANSALHPVVGLLERAAGLGRDDPPEARLAKLEAALGRSDEVVPLLAALLGIPTGTRYPAPALTPEAQKRRTLRALVDQLAGLAAQRPVLALYEDAHWIDPTTLELLDLVVERVQRLRVLVLVTFRPEFRPPWTGHAHVTTLSMSRLARRQGADLVARVAGGRELPAAVVEEIVARTDGVPLFVEELTKAVLESGLLAEAGGRYELAGPVPALAIPTTLHDSLMARLDRLAPVKEVAQIGAVIGREFSHELLAAVAPMSGNQLGDALEQLVGAELVFRRGTAPGATYSFKHALVQDAAYQSLLRSRRHQLHARIAEVLERRVPDVGPEVLAHHLTEAGLAERAIPYWRRAGELAADRSANVEAIAHLGRGLELLETLPATPERLGEELALGLAIGGPLTATKGYAAPEVERTYGRALALCERLGRSAELFTALRGLWNYHLVRGELERAQELAERLAGLVADERTAPLRRAYACRALGGTLFFRGRLAEAVPVLDEGVAIEESVPALDDRRADLLLHPESSGVVCRLLSGRAVWLLGLPDAALERVETALDLARRLGHANSLAFALNVASALRCWRREFDAALGHAEEAIGFATEHRQSQWLAFGTICRGYALACLDRPAEGPPSSARAWRTCTGSAPACSTPSGSASWPRPSCGKASPAARSPRWSGRSTRRGPPASATARRSSTGSGALSWRRPGSVPKRRRGCGGRSARPATSGRDPSSSAPRSAWPASWPTEADGPRRATCSPRSTAGSPRASAPRTCGRRESCWTSSGSARRGAARKRHKPIAWPGRHHVPPMNNAG